jgi:sn-glycerol 3-phosphate transport system ATP-binding protein
MAAIELEGVNKSFVRGAAHAVRDLSLSIPDGQYAVLLGPSGCGKSTTLRMIAGLEEPDSGTIRIGDRVVNGVPPQRRDTAFVFQNYALYPHMTAAQNMGFPLRMRGVSQAEIRRQVDEVGRVLSMEHLLDRYPGQLSGGERQRVALGRAMVRQPAAFLLDEPLSNLDAQLRTEMRVELAQLQRRLAATFVFVTHDQVEAMTLADLIAVMNKGVLQQTGTPDEIYRRPANRFVAGFIGSPQMNFVEGMLQAGEGGSVLQTDGLSLPAGRLQPQAETPDRRVVLGIRPEHIRLAAAGSPPMTVELVEHLGSQTFIFGQMPSGHHLTVAADPDRPPKVGDQVFLALDSQHMHFFHPESGERLAARA